MKLIPFLTELEMELEEEIKFFTEKAKNFERENDCAFSFFNKILIIEDDHKLAKLIAELLQYHSKGPLDISLAPQYYMALKRWFLVVLDFYTSSWWPVDPFPQRPVAQGEGGPLVRGPLLLYKWDYLSKHHRRGKY